MRLILLDRFWGVHIPFVRMVKFKFLVHFPVDHRAHPVVSSLILFLSRVTGFSHKRFCESPWLLSVILANLNAVAWMVSILPLIFNSFSLVPKLLGIIPSAPVTIGITVTLMLHNFCHSLARSKHLYRFSLFLNIYSVVHQNIKIHLKTSLFVFFNQD